MTKSGAQERNFPFIYFWDQQEAIQHGVFAASGFLDPRGAKPTCGSLVPRTTPGGQIECLRRTRGYPLVSRTQFVRPNHSHSSQRDWSLPRSEESMIIRTTTCLDSLFSPLLHDHWPPCQRRQKKVHRLWGAVLTVFLFSYNMIFTALCSSSKRDCSYKWDFSYRI